jgi:hypothetical protein
LGIIVSNNILVLSTILFEKVGNRIYTAEKKKLFYCLPNKKEKPYPTYLTPPGSRFSVSEH